MPNGSYHLCPAAIGSSDARLGEIDRLGVQDDAFALTAAGDMEITQLLEIVQAFKVWDV